MEIIQNLKDYLIRKLWWYTFHDYLEKSEKEYIKNLKKLDKWPVSLWTDNFGKNVYMVKQEDINK